MAAQAETPAALSRDQAGPSPARRSGSEDPPCTPESPRLGPQPRAPDGPEGEGRVLPSARLPGVPNPEALPASRRPLPRPPDSSRRPVLSPEPRGGPARVTERWPPAARPGASGQRRGGARLKGAAGGGPADCRLQTPSAWLHRGRCRAPRDPLPDPRGRSARGAGKRTPGRAGRGRDRGFSAEG